MADSDCSPPLSALLCQEDGACLDGGEDEEDGIIFSNGIETTVIGDGDEDDGYIEVLVSREIDFGSRDDGFRLTDWLMTARTEAVRWILKMRACFGFNFHTAYLSVTYLDRFFLRRTIESRHAWAIQLLSIACLSLAAKMEECHVPLLSDFQAIDYRFDGKAIQRMELLVLTTLGWRMRSVTPFPYLSYLVSKVRCKLQAKELLFKATKLILATIETMNRIDYRPSEIASAAFFAASGQGITKKSLDSGMGVISQYGSLEIDNVLSCYNMIQETQRKKLIIGKVLTSKGISSSTNPSMNSSVDDLNNTTSFISISSKRRRLALNAYSCHCVISNKNCPD